MRSAGPARQYAALALAALIFGAALFYAAQVDLGEIARSIAALNGYDAIVGLFGFLAAQAAFGARWWFLVDERKRPTLRVALGYSLVGGMLNSVLPLRAGDVARTVLLSRRHGIRLGDAGAVTAFERVLDALTVALIGLALSTIIILPGGVQRGIGLAVLASIVALLFAKVVYSRAVLPLGRIASRSFGARVAGRLSNALAGLNDALPRLTRPAVILKAALAHVAGWACVVLALAAFLSAFSIEVPLVQAALAIVLMTSLGGIVVQVPAGLGTWHMLAVSTLSIWNVPLETGIAYSLVAHAVGVAVPVLGGLVAVVGLRIGVHGVSQLASSGDVFDRGRD